MKIAILSLAAIFTASQVQGQALIQDFNDKLRNEYRQKNENTTSQQIIIGIAEGAAAAGALLINDRESREIKALSKRIREVKLTQTKEEIQKEIDAIRKHSGSYDVSVRSSRGTEIFTSSSLTKKAQARMAELAKESQRILNLEVDQRTREALLTKVENEINAIKNDPKNWLNSAPSTVGAGQVTSKQLNPRTVRKLQDLHRKLATAPTNAEKARSLSDLETSLKRVEGNIIKRTGNRAIRLVAKAAATFVVVDLGVRGYVLQVLDQDPGLQPLSSVTRVSREAVDCEEKLESVLSLFDEITN